ncbi:LEPR protein, partial [Eolophus roseicapillus]|nr:LEPR protein [Eolophus roseicapilla]
LADWDNELICYKELSEDLTCTWLPVPSAPNTINYTIFLKWDRIPKLFQRNTSSSSITIERKNLYMKRSASIWIAVNYAHDSCVKGKKISVTPSKAGKCLTPSNINAHQITNQLIVKWDLPATPTEYELRYREAVTESTQWTLVPVKSSAVNVTISNLNAMSSYIVQLRCIASDGLYCVCIWSKEILVPHSNLDQQAQDAGFSSKHPTRQHVLLSWLRITQDLLQDCTIYTSASFFQSQFVKLRKLNSTSFFLCNRPHNFTYPGNYFSYTETFSNMPGQIHVKHQGTKAVVTWTPEYNPKCFVVDWGTGKEDMRMKIVTAATGNFTLGN